MPDETPVVIASQLNSMEAGMLCELLESAGIPAAVMDTVVRTTIVEPGDVAARLMVRAMDAARATEIIRASGVFPGPASDEPADIPEEEWSRASIEDDRGHESEHRQGHAVAPDVRGTQSLVRARDGRFRGLVVAAMIAGVAVLLLLLMA